MGLLSDMVIYIIYIYCYLLESDILLYVGVYYIYVIYIVYVLDQNIT